jgi:hypothetical protein
MPAILFVVLGVGLVALVMKKGSASVPPPGGPTTITPVVFVPNPTPIQPQPAPVIVHPPTPSPGPTGLNPDAGPVIINPAVDNSAVHATVTAGGAPLNVRTAPSPTAPVTGTIPDGSTVTLTTTIIDTGTSFNPSECWYGIQFQGMNGFASQAFLTLQ